MLTHFVMFNQFLLCLRPVPATATAAAGNNASPGSRPLSNHVPRSCTKPFPNNPHSDNGFSTNINDQSEGY